MSERTFNDAELEKVEAYAEAAGLWAFPNDAEPISISAAIRYLRSRVEAAERDTRRLDWMLANHRNIRFWEPQPELHDWLLNVGNGLRLPDAHEAKTQRECIDTAIQDTLETATTTANDS